MNKEALDKMINGTQEERRFLSEHSFGLFAVYYFREYFKYSLAPYHYEMIESLEKLAKGEEIRELAFIMFRESAKTTFSKLYIIWLIVFKKKLYINVDSADKENSERILFDIAYELSNNKHLKNDYGVLFSRKKSQDDIKQTKISNFITENGIRVEAHSTQESMRGRIHLNQRPDFLLLDDFETNKTKDSAAYTKQIKDHISEALAGMSSDGIILYLGNYLTEYANVQFLLDRAKTDHKIKILNVPVLNAEGKPTWEAKYALTTEQAQKEGKVSIEDKKIQLGPRVFSYEMMNQPVDEAQAEFKKEWIQKVEEKDIEHMMFTTFITIDPAASKKDTADYTGVCINRVNKENKWYIKTQQLKMNSAELIDHIFYLVETYRPEIIGIEETVYTLAVQPFLEEAMAKRNKFFVVTPLKHNGTNKEQRIRGLIPRMANKGIFFVGDNIALFNEMRVFPRGQNDDVLDSCFIAGTKILTNKGQVNIEDIKQGDLVMTRKGYKRVIESFCTGEKEVISNIGLVGTKTHPVFTQFGWKGLAYVDQSDIIHIWNEKLSCIEEKSIIDIQIQKEATLETIIGGILQKDHQFLYIVKNGLIYTEKFLSKVISTIKMVTIIIMKYLTLSALLQLHMQNTTQVKNLLNKEQEKELIKDLNNFNSHQGNGEKQKKERFGIKSMLQTVFSAKITSKYVLSVIKNIQQKLKWRQNIVEVNVDTDISLGYLDKKTQITIKRKVYNLEVEDEHEYFANNILVHNCAYQEQIAYKPYDSSILDVLDDTNKTLYNSIGV